MYRGVSFAPEFGSSKGRGVRRGRLRALVVSGLLIASVNVVAVAQIPGPAATRVSANLKGSVLSYSAFELAWREEGNDEDRSSAWRLTRDTFITLSNDYPDSIRVMITVINGDPPLEESGGERAHYGWNHSSTRIEIGPKETVYFAVSTGAPVGVTPAPSLDPGDPPGRPDPETPNAGGERVMRGYILAWAVTSTLREVQWDHLFGTATIVDYARGTAWEYNAWAFQARDGIHGEETENCLLFNLDSGQCLVSEVVPGQLDLDGYEFDACPSLLGMDFFAVGADFPPLEEGLPGPTLDTRLTLVPCEVDLRQDTSGPVRTKARFEIFNENGWKKGTTERCITFWDQTALANFDPPNHFLLENLGTDKGHARIEGLASTRCDGGAYMSQDVGLLGVVQKWLQFPGVEFQDTAGVPLTIMGREAGQILSDYSSEPPSNPDGASVTSGEGDG